MHNRRMEKCYLHIFIYNIQLHFTILSSNSQLSLHFIKMSSGNRSQSYSVEEDIQLCHVYLDISQNPIVGINQSKDQFWSRVEMAFQSDARFQTPFRPGNSLRKRMQVINTAVSKLRGCVRQIERMNPSGASNEDIVSIFHYVKIKY